MAYNKAREERKWRIWKQSEEKKLRELGVSDDNISKLRKHDWANFNSDRRYYQRVQDTGTYLDELAASEQDGQSEMKSVEDFLDSIENEKLYYILVTVDMQTLQAALLKTQGFSVGEISLLLGLNEQTVYKRLGRLKEKIKKLLG